MSSAREWVMMMWGVSVSIHTHVHTYIYAHVFHDNAIGSSVN